MMTVERTCKQCESTLPESAEFFHKSPRGRAGLSGICKQCACARTRAWVAANKERKRASDQRYQAANVEHRREVSRQYRKEHRAECNERGYRWRANNQEKSNEQRRRWYYAHREQANATAIAWAATHPDETKAATDRWRAQHPDEVRATHQRRRARKSHAPGSHTASDIRSQYACQSGRCYWCGEGVGKEYHVDHVIPLAKGGPDSPENIVIACPTCNLRKGSKMPEEFVKDLAAAKTVAA